MDFSKYKFGAQIFTRNSKSKLVFGNPKSFSLTPSIQLMRFLIICNLINPITYNNTKNRL